MPIIDVPVGGFARSIHVQQIINWMRGLPAYSEAVSFTGITNLAGYAVTISNLDSVNGRGLLVRNWNQSVELLSVSHAGTVVKPNALSGTYFRVRNFADNADLFSVDQNGASLGGATIVTTNGLQTLTNKTLTTPTLNAAKLADYLDVIQQASAPGTPGSGHVFLYGKTADEFVHLKGSNTGAEKTLVDTDSIQSLQSKTLTSPVLSAVSLTDYIEATQIATPSAPTGGKVRIYSKTGTDLLHYRSSTSGEKTLVDTDSVQTLVNKTISVTTLSGVTLVGPNTNYIDYTETGANPGTAGSGKIRIWMGTDHNAYLTRPDGSAVALQTTALTVPQNWSRTLAVGVL